jgi:hypothetical protein
MALIIGFAFFAQRKAAMQSNRSAASQVRSAPRIVVRENSGHEGASPLKG